MVWDHETGRETLALRGHKEAARVLMAAPGHGLRFYSGGQDGSIKVWEGLAPRPDTPTYLLADPTGRPETPQSGVLAPRRKAVIPP